MKKVLFSMFVASLVMGVMTGCCMWDKKCDSAKADCKMTDCKMTDGKMADCKMTDAKMTDCKMTDAAKAAETAPAAAVK